MKPGRGAHLVKDKLRNLLARYGSTTEAGEIRKRPDRGAAGPVVEDGRADEKPVEPAISDDRLLPVFVGVHFAQRQREK